MAVLTRNAAKKAQDATPPRPRAPCIDRQHTYITVSPSATGLGTLIRWHYPEAPTLSGPHPSRPDADSDEHGPPGDAYSGVPSALGSGSSLSSLSSLSTLSDDEMPPSPTKAASLAEINYPSAHEGLWNADRMPLAWHSTGATPWDDLQERRLADVFEKQWDVLMRRREIYVQHLHDDIHDDEEEEAGFEETADPHMHSEAEDVARFEREDTVPFEELPAASANLVSSRPRPLVPHDTEIIDQSSYSPPIRDSIPVYPAEWAKSPSRHLQYHPTEIIV